MGIKLFWGGEVPDAVCRKRGLLCRMLRMLRALLTYGGEIPHQEKMQETLGA